MWTYEQKTGKLFDPKGALVGTGYAGGNAGANPEGVNNPDLQNVHNVGPLPEGLYTMLSARDSIHVGKYAIPLVPNPNNEMFGRYAFFMHGDKIDGSFQKASDGCIIQNHDVRVIVNNSTDKLLQVVHG